MRAQLPDFPWDALAPYGEKARSHPQGIIDLSQGTPVDPTPEFIQQAFRDASNSPSYPVTIGTAELRSAMRNWATKILGATGEFDVLPTIGSKELVAWLPSILRAKTVLYPKVAYPTYLVGSMIHNSESIAVEIDAATQGGQRGEGKTQSVRAVSGNAFGEFFFGLLAHLGSGFGFAQALGAFVEQGFERDAVDQVDRVEHVAFGLAHLFALGVEHQAVDVDVLERHFAGEVRGHHDHAGDPEEDDVVAGDEDTAW